MSLGGIYAAITFYMQNRPEVDAYLARREAEAERTQMSIESRAEAKELRERLLARRQTDGTA